jgi:peptide/nickel transport system substrate-binding protein
LKKPFLPPLILALSLACFIQPVQINAFPSDLPTLAPSAKPGTSPTPSPTPLPSPSPAVAPIRPPIPGAVQGDWLIYYIGADIDTLNPLILQDEDANVIATLIYEGLTTRDHITGKIVPQLANSWDVSPDKTTFTFHLRTDVKWQDGKPFTADDVKYSYDRIQDPTCDTAPERTLFEDVKSCDVLDPYTIRFVTSKPYYKTVENLGFPVLPKHIYDNGKKFNDNDANRNPIGTGPFKFVEWKTGDRITLERNDNYWGEKHYLKRMVFQVITEPFVAIQLLKKGDIDLDTVSPINWTRSLEHSSAMSRLHMELYNYPAYSYFGFNLRDPLFSDIRVRHAIDLLIPRKEILQDIFLNKYAIPISGDHGFAEGGYNHDVPPTAYDPDAAKKLLSDAGWTPGDDGFLHKGSERFSFTVIVGAGSPNAVKETELMKENFAKAGVELNVNIVQFVSLIKLVEDWKFQAILGSWSFYSSPEADPYQLWHSSQADLKRSSNFLGYKSAEADKLIAEIRAEYDTEKRYSLERDLHRLLYNDCPCCFLFANKQINVYSNRFQTVGTYDGRVEPSYWWVPSGAQKYTELGQ